MDDTDIRMPPEIIHLNFIKGSHKDIIQDVIDKFGLKSEEAKLLMLYGTCKNRFKPSRKYIEKKTGIKKDNISRVRKKLVDHGFIELYKRKTDGTSAIYIDWIQLRDLASIPKDMLGKRKTRRVAKVDHSWTPKYTYLASSLSNETKMMRFASDYWNIPLTDDYSEEDTISMPDSFLEEKRKDAEEFFFEGGFEKEFPEVASMILEPVPF